MRSYTCKGCIGTSTSIRTFSRVHLGDKSKQNGENRTVHCSGARSPANRNVKDHFQDPVLEIARSWIFEEVKPCPVLYDGIYFSYYGGFEN